MIDNHSCFLVTKKKNLPVINKKELLVSYLFRIEKRDLTYIFLFLSRYSKYTLPSISKDSATLSPVLAEVCK